MLTDPACKNASCPADKSRLRLPDAGGLYLEAAPNGARRWFWKYRFGGKEKRLALGSYPGTGLKQARALRDAAKAILKTGTDPVQARQADKAAQAQSLATTYEATAREFHALKAGGWSPAHAAKWLRMNELYAFPHIGSLPVASIKAPLLLATLRKVEAKGILSTVQDLAQMLGQVFRYAVQAGHIEANPAPDLRGALKPHIPTVFPALTEPAKVGELLRAIDGYTGNPATVAALKLSALLFQRPGNIRALEWAWIDEADAVLRVPATEMKSSLHAKRNGPAHMVPLARQAVAVLDGLRPLTGHGRYVFPGARDHKRPMSEGAVNAALARMDFKGEMTAHGFRAMARTMLAERLQGVPADVVEAQLGHGKAGPLGASYDRAEYMPQRFAVMQTWADYLDQLRAGAQVLAFKQA